MADEIADGVSFSGPRRALYQNASIFLELLGNSDLLGIGGFAEQKFAIGLRGDVRRGGGVWRVGNRRFFTDDIQKGPGKIFTRAKVSENALDGSGKSQSARAQKEERVAANARVVEVRIRRVAFQEFTARRQLHHQPLQEAGGGTID